MFNPFDYTDPKAVNPIDSNGIDLSLSVTGNAAVAESLLASGAWTIGIDGYTTAPFEILCEALKNAAARRGVPLSFLPVKSLLRPPEELTREFLAHNLPDDRVKDPVLLYGRLFDGEYEDLFDSARLAAAAEEVKSYNTGDRGVLVLYGYGALCSSLIGLVQHRCWIDVIPIRVMLNLKAGTYRNLGWVEGTDWVYKQVARRCYFVDFELALRSRMRIFKDYGFDSYIAGSAPESLRLLPVTLVKQIFRRGLEYPLRCRPVYLEGVWGGYYIKQLRHLPDSMKNCAWVFDLIPMEVSVAFSIDGMEFEFPFYDLVQTEGERLMGPLSVARFGNYFPIRFNYDDTFHANGNMSIQCHPVRDYIRAENGENDRQDESYYVVATGQDAKTYLGFNEGVEPQDFIDVVKQSERDKIPVDYKKYVNAVESKPGVQVMIPAGTVHASGRNQVVLEIGSLTVGSYTYKMYDYLRLDLDGNPRPIHTYHASHVLQPGRNASWVRNNIVQAPRALREGADWSEYIVGEHDLIYFSLRNVRFVSRYEDDTAGKFHVLALADGERVMVRSLSDPSRFFVMDYLEIVCVPADMGKYEVVNLVEGTTVTMHKTLLKDGFEFEDTASSIPTTVLPN